MENKNFAKTNWAKFALESTEFFVRFVCLFLNLLRDISWLFFNPGSKVSVRQIEVYCAAQLESIYICSAKWYRYIVP